MLRIILIAGLTALVIACAAPLVPEVAERIEPGLDFAAVKADPTLHTGKVLVLGGSILTLRDETDGHALELFRWDLNRLHEPLAPAEAGDRFLVRSRQPLDPDLFTPGRLVTLGAAVDGTGTIVIHDHEEIVPAFHLVDIHLWDSPFRYGLHPNSGLAQPEYIRPVHPGPDNPYDPTPWAFPYSPYWYRNN